MWRYVLGRTAHWAVNLLVLSFLLFALFSLIPDCSRMILG